MSQVWSHIQKPSHRKPPSADLLSWAPFRDLHTDRAGQRKPSDPDMATAPKFLPPVRLRDPRVRRHCDHQHRPPPGQDARSPYGETFLAMPVLCNNVRDQNKEAEASRRGEGRAQDCKASAPSAQTIPPRRPTPPLKKAAPVTPSASATHPPEERRRNCANGRRRLGEGLAHAQSESSARIIPPNWLLHEPATQQPPPRKPRREWSKPNIKSSSAGSAGRSPTDSK